RGPRPRPRSPRARCRPARSGRPGISATSPGIRSVAFARFRLSHRTADQPGESLVRHAGISNSPSVNLVNGNVVTMPDITGSDRAEGDGGEPGDLPAGPGRSPGSPPSP